MQNSFDFIDDYLAHALSPQDAIVFEKQLHNDTMLSEAVASRKQLQTHLKRLRLKQLIVETTGDMPVPTSPSYRWLWIGASITLFSIALGYFIWKNDDIPAATPAPIIESTVPKPTVVPLTEEPRADAKSKIIPNEKVILPIAKNNEDKTLVIAPIPRASQNKALDSIAYAIADAPIGYDNWKDENTAVRGNESSDESMYFQAYKNLKNGNVNQANTTFAALAENKQFRNYRRAQWYLVLGQLSQNPSSRNETLNTIANTQGHYFQQKAKAIKRYLQKNNR